MQIMASPTVALENPYVGLLYSHVADVEGVEVVEFNGWRLHKESFDIVHIHWPEQIFWGSKRFSRKMLKALYILISLYVGRRRGAKLFWTAHNLKPHDLDWDEKLIMAWYWPLFLLMVDAHISLSHSGQVRLLRQCPRLKSRPGFVIRHGHYRAIYPNGISKPEARIKLGISNSVTVIGFIGLIRKYKNLPALIDCFRSLTDKDLVLIIAGNPISKNLREKVVKAARGDERIICNLQFIPVNEIQIYMNASDLIVLPFAEVLNSGSVLLALSFNKPILTVSDGVVLELQKMVGETWIRTYDNLLTPRQLQDAVKWATNRRLRNLAPLEKLNWPGIGEQTVEAYRCVIDHQFQMHGSSKY